jgi:hypothetical protein
MGKGNEGVSEIHDIARRGLEAHQQIPKGWTLLPNKKVSKYDSIVEEYGAALAEQVLADATQIATLRRRTHELQERADKIIGSLVRANRHWRITLKHADKLLEEDGIAYQSAIVRAAVSKLLQQKEQLEAERDKARRDLVAVERLRWPDGRPTAGIPEICRMLEDWQGPAVVVTL